MNVRFIHIGCHKCGSTFLQAEVWPKIKGLKPLQYLHDYPIYEEMEYLIRCGELYYEEDKIKKAIHDKIAQYEDVCLSSEAFSGTDSGILGQGHQIKYIAERLHTIFGATKILIVIRDQRKALPSLYLDDVKYGYLTDFKQWIHWRLNTCGLNYFKYAPMIECYMNLFGKGNVKVVLFEELFKIETIQRILDDFDLNSEGIKTIDFSKRFNEAYSAPSLAVARVVNILSGSKLTYGSIYGPAPVKMYNLWRYKCAPVVDRLSKKLNIPAPKCNFDGYDEILYEQFHESNMRVSEIIGKDLTKYGYV